MSQPGFKTNTKRYSLARRGAPATCLLLMIGALLASTATAASYEQVAKFETGGAESSRLVNAAGIAVNVNGAGGVTAGTVYAVTNLLSSPKLLRYTSDAAFVDVHSIDAATSIAIDQQTGNVYVLTESPGFHVTVYNPAGTAVLASFGEQAPSGQPIETAPGKFHRAFGIAVDNAGTVYVSDLGFAEAHETGGQQSRVMLFKQQASGDVTTYAYTGRPNDLAASNGTLTYEPMKLAVDAVGNLYTSGDSAIDRFSTTAPAPPTCEFTNSAGGIRAMTVNPATGEVLYSSLKDGKGHQLTCNGAGEFIASGTFAITPKPTPQSTIEAFGFNPAKAWEAERPAGALYAAANGSGLGYVFAPPIPRDPLVVSESVADVTATTAAVGARIDPKGTTTSYVFQYIGEGAYEANEPTERFAGAAEAPLGGAVLGGGQEVLSAAAVLSDLSSDSEYHYRVIATSHCDEDEPAHVCEDVGEDQHFRTYPVETTGLFDNRAWELVSPARKDGGEVLPADPGISSCGGECKPGAFMTHSPMQSAPSGEAIAYEGLPFSYAGSAVLENEYVSRRDAKTGWQTTALSPALQESGLDQGHQALSSDLSRGILYQQVGSPLSPAAPSGYANLYAQSSALPAQLDPLLEEAPPNRLPGRLELRFAGASGDLSKIFFAANDALTGATPFAPAAEDEGESSFNLYEWSAGQLRLVNVTPSNAETTPGAAFGSPQTSNANRAVLAHAISDDGSRVFWTSKAGQVYVRENGESTEAIPGAGSFRAASADGSKVLLDEGRLYDVDDLAVPPVDLTQGKGGFKGILGQSEGLSRIYFVDTAVLDESPNDQGAVAEVGQNNLYAWHEGTSVFIASLPPGSSNDWLASPVQRTAEASPGGAWLAFLSGAPLTGYDNVGPACVPVSGTAEFAKGPCVEAFLYDSATSELICASCNRSNERPIGASTLRLIEGADGSQLQPRYLTDEGRLYFDSRDSLTLSDTNEGVEDVYEYEPNGVGSCMREVGCVSLISSGRGGIDSNFLAMDESGKNVFFTTRDQLVLKDKDELVDLYDAREDGGIPAESEVARSECQGEACQPPIAAPNDPTPGSSTFESGGNSDEKKVKKHRKKRKHAKKQSHRRAANHKRGGGK